MAVGTKRRAKKTASRLEHALLLQPMANAMPFDSSDRSPTVAPAVAGAAPSYTSSHRRDSHPASTGPESATTLQSSKTKHLPKGTAVSELRRSTSTPHMRNLALASSTELSPTSSKPRNKLGYHRSSVACGHCRRRKIRCLLAPDDPQGRCANCIRLKKECNFYPVEHSPDLHRTHVVSAKDGSTGVPQTPITPASSSPRQLPTSSGEKMSEFRPPFHVPPGLQDPMHRLPGDPDPSLHPGQLLRGGKFASNPISDAVLTHLGHPLRPSRTYSQTTEPQWAPPVAFLPSSTIAESPTSNMNFWRQSPSTTNSVYSGEQNYSGDRTPTTVSTSSTLSYSHQDPHTWSQQPSIQPPTRSVSYGHAEGLHQQFGNHGLGIQPHDYSRRTYPYPTNIDTNSPAILPTSLVGMNAAPLSAPIVPNTQHFPPVWSSYTEHSPQDNTMQVPGRSMSANWFPGSGPLDQVQEEGASSIGYNQHDLPQFYSGS